MKRLSIFSITMLLASINFIASAQDKTEKIKVAGECGMCKNKIEKAAKEAGATLANWNADNKELTVTYNSTSSNTAKIEKAIAAVGYDTQHEKATEAAYNSLHACCKYERQSVDKTACCTDGSCTHCQEKCGKDAACCKTGTCSAHHQAGDEAKCAQHEHAKGAACCSKDKTKKS